MEDCIFDIRVSVEPNDGVTVKRLRGLIEGLPKGNHKLRVIFYIVDPRDLSNDIFPQKFDLKFKESDVKGYDGDVKVYTKRLVIDEWTWDARLKKRFLVVVFYDRDSKLQTNLGLFYSPKKSDCFGYLVNPYNNDKSVRTYIIQEIFPKFKSYDVLDNRGKPDLFNFDDEEANDMLSEVFMRTAVACKAMKENGKQPPIGSFNFEFRDNDSGSSTYGQYLPSPIGCEVN